MLPGKGSGCCTKGSVEPVGTLRLLLIEDDQKLCRLLRQYLQPLGYEISFAHDGASGLAQAQTEDFDAVILDVMLPKLNGLEVLKKLREQSDVPVLMLTGLGEEADRIAGLEIGADDYLPKTFSTRELLARLRAVMRRPRALAPSVPAARGIHLGLLSISVDTHRVTMGGKPVPLTPTEFDLLHSLARAAGRVKTREQLLIEVGDRDFEAFDRSIDIHISSLRRKLSDDAKDPQLIVTVRGVGYMMRNPDDRSGEEI